MPDEKTVYVLVKVKVKIKSPLDEDDDDVAAIIGNDADYNVSITHDNLEVTDTELVWSGDEDPTN